MLVGVCREGGRGKCEPLHHTTACLLVEKIERQKCVHNSVNIFLGRQLRENLRHFVDSEIRILAK